MDFIGTSARENYVGTIDADEFDMSQGGRDTVSGLEGDDVFIFGSEFNANDEIDGGADHDTLILNGNYLGGVIFTPTTLVNVEEIVCEAGFNYSLTFDDATSAGFFTVDATALGVGEALVFDGTAETTGDFNIFGGAGDDLLTVSYRGAFYLGNGGSDTAVGGSSTDNFHMDAAFDAGDSLVGGGGEVDGLLLAGDYSAGLTITGSMLTETEIILISGFWSGSFIVEDAVVGAGMTVRPVVISFSVPVGFSTLTIDGSAETDGFWSMTGGVTDDVFTGGALADIFDFADDGSGGQDGVDIADGGDGDDTFRFDGKFTRDDQVDGGVGFDVLEIEGDLSAGVNFGSNTMRGVEQITLLAGYDYDLTVGNNNVAADGFTVLGDGLLAGDHLIYDGGAESVSDLIVKGGADGDTLITGGGDDSLVGANGADSLVGGAGDDTILGGRGQDVLFGGAGTDHIEGNLAANTFVYTGVAESTGAGRDDVGVLKPLKDHFDMDVTVTGVDARVNVGNLSTASFDADLAAAIGAGQLGAGHALVFNPNGGTLAGQFFLVVDANGAAGYQAAEDYVMEFAYGSHPNQIAVGFFI